MVRKPPTLGSWAQPSPSGRAVRGRASWGGRGGAIGRLIRLPRYRPAQRGPAGQVLRGEVERRLGYQLRRSSVRRESAPNFDESTALAPKTPRTVKRLI